MADAYVLGRDAQDFARRTNTQLCTPSGYVGCDDPYPGDEVWIALVTGPDTDCLVCGTGPDSASVPAVIGIMQPEGVVGLCGDCWAECGEVATYPQRPEAR